MKVTFDDPADGSQFVVDITHGEPTAGSLVFVHAPDGSDRRIYKVLAVNGTTLKIERQPLSAGVLL